MWVTITFILTLIADLATYHAQTCRNLKVNNFLMRSASDEKVKVVFYSLYTFFRWLIPTASIIPGHIKGNRTS